MPTAAVHWNVTAIENHAGRWLQRCRMQLFSCRHISDKLLKVMSREGRREEGGGGWFLQLLCSGLRLGILC